MGNYREYRKSVRRERKAARAEERRIDRLAREAKRAGARGESPQQPVSARPGPAYGADRADEYVGRVFGAEPTLKQKIRRESREHMPARPLYYAVGLIIVALAIVGIVFIVTSVSSFFDSKFKDNSEIAQFNAILTPIAATDPDAFDAVTSADSAQLIDAAIWYILENKNAPDSYSTSRGRILIPEEDVITSLTALFGSEVADRIKLTNVNGYNYVFEYDSANMLYKIPITSIEPVYTPNVTDVERGEDTITVTVEYIQAASWVHGEGQIMTEPTADKTMKVTFRKLSGKYYISAIQTVSANVPETVAVAPAVTVRESETFTRQEYTTVAETTTETTTAASGSQFLGGDLVW